MGRYVKKSKSNRDESAFSYKPKFDGKKIFSTEEEAEIVNHLKQASRLHYGLTAIQTRKLAYDYAVANGNIIPDWQENKIAEIS
ncbi:hypothetical protein RN001_004151 [Aquatica leii]|uniref:Uncharacterized protein n=1 Tax=Aquatica leii TaxID=1421715 RepID=A0AAN7ST58_9COLE|nr:hypothetical protein RN001_004151 [Aquatica leii]